MYKSLYKRLVVEMLNSGIEVDWASLPKQCRLLGLTSLPTFVTRLLVEDAIRCAIAKKNFFTSTEFGYDNRYSH